MQPVIIRNQGTETVWHPRRCDLPRGIVECEGSPCYLPCREGRLCSLQQHVVTQDQRYKVGFKSDAEMRADGWEPVSAGRVWAVLLCVVCGSIALMLGLHFWRS